MFVWNKRKGKTAWVDGYVVMNPFYRRCQRIKALKIKNRNKLSGQKPQNGIKRIKHTYLCVICENMYARTYVYVYSESSRDKGVRLCVSIWAVCMHLCATSRRPCACMDILGGNAYFIIKKFFQILR